jgi:hypothetical protein
MATEVEVGATETVMALTVMVIVADLVASATDVALTTVPVPVPAVYTPPTVIEPLTAEAPPSMDQVTAVFTALVTVAEQLVVSPARRVVFTAEAEMVTVGMVITQVAFFVGSDTDAA